MTPATTSLLPEPFLRWFAARGWNPRAHQLELLAKARAGRCVLLIAPTGGGKTLAGFLPSLVELSSVIEGGREACLHTLYISPLKALAVDIARNLERPVAERPTLARPGASANSRARPSESRSPRFEVTSACSSSSTTRLSEPRR